jgi:DNA-binding response OmpR family regulator
MFGDVQVDLYEMTVRRCGKPVVLTTQEFKALRFLLLNPRRVLSREELLSQAWGYENYPSTRTVDNYILKLRQKLETDPSKPMHFQTVHGTGYKFVP